MKRDAAVAQVNRMDYSAMLAAYGQPDDRRRIMAGDAWPESAPVKPSAPAEALAIGICLAERTHPRQALNGSGSWHPLPCGWCDYPDAILRQALAYARAEQAIVAAEIVTWRIDDGEGGTIIVDRSGPSSRQPLDAKWRGWWRSDAKVRHDLIRVAQYGPAWEAAQEELPPAPRPPSMERPRIVAPAAPRNLADYAARRDKLELDRTMPTVGPNGMPQ